MALQWIRDNVDKFGGDPHRITMFGQSAGAGMVDFYSFAYASDPIARGFILMSATINGFPPVAAATANQKWFNMTQEMGCGSSDTDPMAVMECIMSKTTAEIEAGFALTDVGLGNSVFGPTVDNVMVFDNYNNRTSARGGYLIGNTQNEAGLFRIFNPNQPDSYWETFNNVSYTCADALRVAQTTRDGNPTWRYRYFGDFPNMAVTTTPPSGAYHTSDVSTVSRYH
jgi:carboxylesterase type B